MVERERLARGQSRWKLTFFCPLARSGFPENPGTIAFSTRVTSAFVDNCDELRSDQFDQ